MVSFEISAVFLFCIFGTISSDAGLIKQSFSHYSGPVVFPSLLQQPQQQQQPQFQPQQFQPQQFQPQQQPSGSFNPFLPIPQSPCQTKGAVLLGNKCILVESTELNWSEASRYCGQLGYKLMEITSGEDYFRFISYLRSRALFASSYWVGAAKLNNFFWSWVSRGQPIHTTFWAVTIVNGKGVKEPLPDFYQSKACGFLDKKRAHFLNTENCQEKHRFVCEREVQTGGHPFPTNPIPQQAWWPTFFEGDDDDGNGDDRSHHTEHFTCPEGWESSSQYSEKCYMINKDDPKDWMDASEDCTEKGGSLAVILTLTQNNEIQGLNQGNNDCWIGLSNQMDTWSWIGVTPPIVWQNWKSGDPSTGNCGSLLSDGTWESNICTEDKGYICQIDAISDN